MKCTINNTIIFAIIFFILGFVFIINYSSKNVLEGYGNLESFIGSSNTNCPNLLMKKDDKYFLYNTTKVNVPGVNPIVLNNLEEYKQFMKWMRSRGIRCPVLFLQQTYDTQGQRTYRMLNDPENPNIGLPIQPIFDGTDPNMNKITKLYDAHHDKGNMPGFDPLNQYIGLKTPLDEMEHQTNFDGLSDNPMDPNWGGVEYSRKQVESGKYADDEVSIYVG
jgi:hypothetical protein